MYCSYRKTGISAIITNQRVKLFLLFFLFLLYSFSGYCQKADMVLTNGNIITLAKPGDRVEAVAIVADKIIATGTNESIKSFITNQTRVIDLQGKTVVPGFNDVHQHPAPVYAWDKPYASLRLDTVSSMGSLIQLLKRKAVITPKGMLITGVAYNEVKLGGQPIRDSLDKASTDHPILISHASGHLSAANSYLLNLNHITRETKDPPGGALERDKDGRARWYYQRVRKEIAFFNQCYSDTQTNRGRRTGRVPDLFSQFIGKRLNQHWRLLGYARQSKNISGTGS